MKNIIKKSIQNSSLSNQVSLFLGQTTLLVCLMLVSFASLQAQVVLQDFSALENTATDDVYGGFGGGQTATNALVDDPAPFTSNKVREVTTTATGNVWKGVFFRPQTNYIDLTVTKTVSLKIYTTTASYFKGKIQAGQSGQAAIELATSEAHTGSGWETLTFTFPTATGEWGEMVVFTNVNASGVPNIVRPFSHITYIHTHKPDTFLSLHDFLKDDESKQKKESDTGFAFHCPETTKSQGQVLDKRRKS